jgi:hypothetical protein
MYSKICEIFVNARAGSRPSRSIAMPRTRVFAADPLLVLALLVLAKTGVDTAAGGVVKPGFAPLEEVVGVLAAGDDGAVAQAASTEVADPRAAEAATNKRRRVKRTGPRREVCEELYGIRSVPICPCDQEYFPGEPYWGETCRPRP